MYDGYILCVRNGISFTYPVKDGTETRATTYGFDDVLQLRNIKGIQQSGNQILCRVSLFQVQHSLTELYHSQILPNESGPVSAGLS
jgi:hypothetical protein